jgi:hypothetical protein
LAGEKGIVVPPMAFADPVAYVADDLEHVLVLSDPEIDVPDIARPGENPEVIVGRLAAI